MEAVNINRSFCENILQTYQKNKNIQVFEIKKNLATSKGDNYLSDIYRVFVRYIKTDGDNKFEEGTRFIVKMKPSKMEKESNLINKAFHYESKIFMTVLPRIEKYVGCTVAPFLFYGDENENYIAMQDLGKYGYHVANRSKGLSFQQCLIIIEKMAKFHAGSVVIQEREPHLLKTFDSESLFKNMPQTFYKILEMSVLKLSNSITENWKEEEYLEIARKLIKFSNNVQAAYFASFEHDSNEFCVLNHGDFWINNIMLQDNKEKNTCDVRLIDFQAITYTSPAIDLQLFLAMCPELEVKGDKDEHFLETYLNILTNTMTEIGCKTKPPTIQQLKEAMKKRRIHSIIAGLIYYPRSLADKKDVESLTDIFESGETKLDVFQIPEAEKVIRKFSKIIKNKGYLD